MKISDSNGTEQSFRSAEDSEKVFWVDFSTGMIGENRRPSDT